MQECGTQAASRHRLELESKFDGHVIDGALIAHRRQTI